MKLTTAQMIERLQPGQIARPEGAQLRDHVHIVKNYDGMENVLMWVLVSKPLVLNEETRKYMWTIEDPKTYTLSELLSDAEPGRYEIVATSADAKHLVGTVVLKSVLDGSISWCRAADRNLNAELVKLSALIIGATFKRFYE